MALNCKDIINFTTMFQTAYKNYTDIFGHSQWLLSLSNLYSNDEKKVHSSASIKRTTDIFGQVHISKDVSISNECHISGDVIIKEGTILNGYNSIIGDVEIGKYCAIAPRARMRSSNHATYKPSLQMELNDRIGSELRHISKPIKVGNDVWICSGAKVLSGVSVGDGAVIAADSVVVDDVEPYSIVAGNPAEHKRYRFKSNIIEELIELEWWEWDMEKIRNNKEFFETDLREYDSIETILE